MLLCDSNSWEQKERLISALQEKRFIESLTRLQKLIVNEVSATEKLFTRPQPI